MDNEIIKIKQNICTELNSNIDYKVNILSCLIEENAKAANNNFNSHIN